VGPHFRYEEESLYPVLKTLLGENVDQPLSEHNGVIDTAKTCAALLQKDSLTGEEAERTANAAKALLVHAANCDGLALLSERFKPKRARGVRRQVYRGRKSQCVTSEVGQRYIYLRKK